MPGHFAREGLYCMKGPEKNKNAEAVMVLSAALLWNQGVYYAARLLTKTWRHYDMTTPMDLLVPFLPWTVLIYFGCFLFWCVNYYLCAVQEKSKRDRFFCADALAKGICLLFFLAIPTTNVRPEIAGETGWDALIKLLYQIDAADNLFPSIHCVVSWLSWIGVRGRKEIPLAYRSFSLIAAIAVCISTLTTKQHVIVDAIGGVMIAEGCYRISGIPKVLAAYARMLSRLLKLRNRVMQ